MLLRVDHGRADFLEFVKTQLLFSHGVGADSHHTCSLSPSVSPLNA